MISGLVFWTMAIYLWVERPALNMMPEVGSWGNPLAWVLAFWGSFRFYTAFLQWQGKRRQDQNQTFQSWWVLALLSVAMGSCTPFDFQKAGQDVPTAGRVEIGFDRGDSLMVMQWITQFESEYPKAKVVPVFLNESELLKRVEEGSIEGFYLHRELDSLEQKGLASRGVKVRSVKVAKTAVALVTHSHTALKSLTHAQFSRLFSQGGLWVVSKQSSELRSALAFANSLDSNQTWRVQESGTVQALLDRIQQDPTTLGLLPLNVLVDKRDSFALKARSRCAILGLEEPVSGAVSYPFQSDLARNQYAMAQPLVAYDLQGYSGLVSGFMAYVSSQPGQIIVKKSGLLPQTPPARTIQLQ